LLLFLKFLTRVPQQQDRLYAMIRHMSTLF